MYYSDENKSSETSIFGLTMLEETLLQLRKVYIHALPSYVHAHMTA